MSGRVVITRWDFRERSRRYSCLGNIGNVGSLDAFDDFGLVRKEKEIYKIKDSLINLRLLLYCRKLYLQPILLICESANMSDNYETRLFINNDVRWPPDSLPSFKG